MAAQGRNAMASQTGGLLLSEEVVAVAAFPRALRPTLKAVNITDDNNINRAHVCKVGAQEGI